MQETTHREFLAWIEWLDEEDNRPSRTDNYLMQIAAEVRRSFVKRPAAVKFTDFLLKFTRKKKKPSKAEREKIWKMQKAHLLAAVGYGGKDGDNRS